MNDCGEEIITKNRFSLLNPDCANSDENTLKSDIKVNDRNYPAGKCNISHKVNLLDINCNLYSKYYMSENIINYNRFDNRFVNMYNNKNDIYILTIVVI